MTRNTAASGGCSAHEPQDVDVSDVMAILAKHGRDRAALITILGDIQARYRYLPADALRIVAAQTGCSLVDVYAAATFYRSFSLKPKGKHLVSVCLGTACHVRGAPGVKDEFQRQLGIVPGETTPDREFTLETMNCLGACALGPMVVADGRFYSKVSATDVGQILRNARQGPAESPIERRDGGFAVEAACPHCGGSLMNAHHLDGHRCIQMEAICGGLRGWLKVSAVYGGKTRKSEHEIDPDAVLHPVCPRCRRTLAGDVACLECGSPMAELGVKGGAVLRVCMRRGCGECMLDLVSKDG